MPVDSMQEQEGGRNAGPVHERPLRQSAGPDAERATMRRTVCVVRHRSLVHETPHIGRRRAGLHRYGRIRRAVYPSPNAPERQRAPRLELPHRQGATRRSCRNGVAQSEASNADPRSSLLACAAPRRLVNKYHRRSPTIEPRASSE